MCTNPPFALFVVSELGSEVCIGLLMATDRLLNAILENQRNTQRWRTTTAVLAGFE